MRNKMMLLMGILFLLGRPIFAQTPGGRGHDEVNFFRHIAWDSREGFAESAKVRQLPAPRKRLPAILALPVESASH